VGGCLLSRWFALPGRPLSFPFIARILGLLALAVSLPEQSAEAANRTWQNNGTDFNTAGNWSGGGGGVVPGPNDVARFNSAMGTQPNLSASLTIQELNFSTAAASGYDLTSSNTGIKLTLTNTGTAGTSAINASNTSGTNIIDAPIVLGAGNGLTQTFTQLSGGTLIVNGAISSTNNVTLSLDGGGVIQLSGANTYSGGTTLVNGTTVRINNATALGTGTFTINSGTIDNTTAGAITLSNNNAQAWNGDFTFTGTRSLDLGTGAVTLGASRIVTVNANNLTVGGVISGSGLSLTKAGAGTLTLGGANNYTGGTTINLGNLNINNATALGTGTFTIAGGSSAVIDNTTAGAITLSTNNAQVWNGNFTFTGTQSLNLGTGAVTLGGNRTVTVNANNLTVGGVISGGSSLTKAGNGTLTLGGANIYTGGTIFGTGTPAGTLNINNATALGTGTFTISGGSNAIIDNTTAGAITLSNNNAQVWNGNFTFTGTQSLNLGVGAVTLGGSRIVTVNANNLTVGGIISGSGFGLTKAGNGTLTLSGANTYTGGTTVNAGKLLVNGNNSAAIGAVSVNNSGTTLGGTGTIGGAVTVGNGANLLGGTGTTASGTLTLANSLTLNSGSIIELALGASGAHSTLARTGGTWTFNALQAFTFIDLGAQATTYNNIITGLAADPVTEASWIITNTGWIGTFTYNGGNINLNVVAVPEPATYLAAVLTLGALLLHQRRRWRCLLRRHVTSHL
jgi:autotransporter-associated beta strand protein